MSRKIDDETLSRWLDDELEQVDTALVDKAINSDPAAANRAENLRARVLRFAAVDEGGRDEISRQVWHRRILQHATTGISQAVYVLQHALVLRTVDHGSHL